MLPCNTFTRFHNPVFENEPKINSREVFTVCFAFHLHVPLKRIRLKVTNAFFEIAMKKKKNEHKPDCNVLHWQLTQEYVTYYKKY